MNNRKEFEEATGKWQHSAGRVGKTVLTAGLAAVMAFAPAAQVFAAGEAWTNAELAGNVTTKQTYQAKDDFAAYANQEWLANASIPDGGDRTGTFLECADNVVKRKMALIGNASIQDHNEELATDLYELATGWETRNTYGIEPLVPYVQNIQGIQNMEQLETYLKDASARYCQPLFGVSIQNSGLSKGDQVVSVSFPDRMYSIPEDYEQLSDYGETEDKLNRGMAVYMLKRLGYSAKEAQRLYNSCLSLEKEMAAYDYTTEELNSSEIMQMSSTECQMSDIKKAEGNFPMSEILESTGYGSSERYNIVCAGLLGALNQIYNEEHLEAIKAYYIVHTAVDAIWNLDQEAYEYATDLNNEVSGVTGTVSLEEYGIACVDAWLPYVIDYLYIDAYCTTQMRQDVERMVADYKAYYEEMLRSETWLSEETREKAIEKLKAIRVRAAYPDKRMDFSALSLADLQDGGSYFAATQRIRAFMAAKDQQNINKKIDPEIWDGITTSETNAMYSPATNEIYILAGILLDPMYNENDSYEEKLGSLGLIIGHELSHAFDTKGAQYDKDGNLTSWWKEEDFEVFQQRSQALIDYMSSISVPDTEYDLTVNGDLVVGEVTADLGGMKASLGILSRQENPDYDAFFRGYAKAWRQVALASRELYQVRMNEHPLNYLRINVTLSQFQEFMDTYNVQLGDGMYVAPEDRVLVW